MKSKIYGLSVMPMMIASVFLASSVFLTGCGRNVKKTMPSPDTYYKKASYDSQHHNYSGATKNFKALIENYPSYVHIKEAELKLGDAYYLEKKFIEAQGAYTDFVYLNPGSKHVPFAMYYAAMSYYNRKEQIGRTQVPLLNAKATFEKLISSYPYSKYSKKAFKYIKIINMRLSENSFFSGLYYFNAGLWKPASYMFKTMLKQYEGLPIIPKALYYLIISYKNMNNKKMENHYKNILHKKYPQSKYLKVL